MLQSADVMKKNSGGCILLHNIVNNPYASNSLLEAVLKKTPWVEETLNYTGCDLCKDPDWDGCDCRCNCNVSRISIHEYREMTFF